MREGKDGKNYSTRVGAGWIHRKGGGINVQLEAVPLDGRIVLFPVTEKSE
jgi:hypothetical protein